MPFGRSDWPDLDPEQYAAVTSSSRRVRGLAGAGTGKTRVLTARTRWLVEAERINPARICQLTFTRKAADEMRVRLGPLGDLLGHLGTIHSLGYTVLHSVLPGRKVADESVRRRLIRKAMAELKSSAKFADVHRAISLAKSLGHGVARDFAREASKYEGLLQEAKLWDLDDLILQPVRALSGRPEQRAKWQHRFDAILVDECQDTSALQWDLLYWLLRPDSWLFLAGDVSQSIYAFRGADPGLMLQRADESFGFFEDFSISHNYRSRAEVCAAANHMVRGRAGAVMLTPTRGPHPFCLQVLRGCTEAEEVRLAMGNIEDALASGFAPAQCAVLTRTNAALEAYESECLTRKLPYLVVTGVSFYGRAEILDVLAYLAAGQAGWAQPDAEALERIYNKPTRYLGAAWFAELQAGGGWAALGEGRVRFSRGYMEKRAGELVDDIADLHRAIQGGEAPANVVRDVLSGIGYRDWLIGDQPSDADEVKGENLDQLVEVAKRYQTVAELLDFAAECRQRTAAAASTTQVGGRIQLSTIHRAKGLEWPLVVVGGLEDGLLPHAYGQPEEERRVFYVAMTRAKERLILATRSGRDRAATSPFVLEVCEHFGVPLAWGDEDDDDVPVQETIDLDQHEEGWTGADAEQALAGRGASDSPDGGDDDAAADATARGGGAALRGAGDGESGDGAREDRGAGGGSLCGVPGDVVADGRRGVA